MGKGFEKAERMAKIESEGGGEVRGFTYAGLARRSFAVLAVFARCGLFLYIIGAKFLAAA